ncbi:MAG: PorV/PorQ family protein [Elusimicrobia bacterium]|nr:PorV/PorQ family protein [Elusimicrobiota bacterium]
MVAAALLIVALGAAERIQAFGADGKGSSAAQFLKIGPGARASAMGEAMSGVADDAYAAYYNPAGLGWLVRPEVAGMHDSHFQGINYEHAVVAVPVLSWVETKLERNAYGVMGLAITNLSVGGLERRSATETDTAADTFSSSDLAYAVSYGYAFPKLGLSAGATIKYVESTIDSVHAGAVASDVGFLWRGKKWSAGVGGRHMSGEDHKFARLSDPLPLTVYGGLGFRPHERVLVAFDVASSNDAPARLAWGGEYRHPFTPKLSGSLRGGYSAYGAKSYSSSGWTGASFGGGVGYGNFDIDFAWVPYGDLGNSLRYSLHVKF